MKVGASPITSSRTASTVTSSLTMFEKSFGEGCCGVDWPTGIGSIDVLFILEVIIDNSFFSI